MICDVRDPVRHVEDVVGHGQVHLRQQSDRVGEELGQQKPAGEQDSTVVDDVEVVRLRLDGDAARVEWRVGVVPELLDVRVEERRVVGCHDEPRHLSDLEVEPAQAAAQLDRPVTAHRVDPRHT